MATRMTKAELLKENERLKDDTTRVIVQRNSLEIALKQKTSELDKLRIELNQMLRRNQQYKQAVQDMGKVIYSITETQ